MRRDLGDRAAGDGRAGEVEGRPAQQGHAADHGGGALVCQQKNAWGTDVMVRCPDQASLVIRALALHHWCNA